MLATDFDLSKDIRFNPETGVTTFRDTRLLILDANSLGALRHDLLELVGRPKTRELILRFGYQHGFADLLQMKLTEGLDSERELLAAGPVLHTWQGMAGVAPGDLRFDRATGEFLYTGVWMNSWEADQHLMYEDPSADPVCWSLTGYASGYASAFFERPLLACESLCRGRGDPRCEWLIQPPDRFGPEADPYIEALAELWRQTL